MEIHFFLEDFSFQETLKIMNYGDFSLEKGIPLLVIIFPFIREFFPEVKLYIAGRGENKGKCEKLIYYLSKGKRNEFFSLLGELVKNFGEKYGAIMYMNFVTIILLIRYLQKSVLMRDLELKNTLILQGV